MFAFLHHVAAFVLVSALALELVLIRVPLSVTTAHKLRLADRAYGASAGAVLIVGFVRVLYFEKGAAYYFHSVPFLAKLTLFIIVGLLSIYPTVEFLSWGKALKSGQVPVVGEQKQRLIRRLVHWELAAIVVLILCAALMARGVGFIG